MDKKQLRGIHSEAMDLANDFINRKIERVDFEAKLYVLAEGVKNDVAWFNTLFLSAIKAHEERTVLVKVFDTSDRKNFITQRTFKPYDFLNDEIEYYAANLAKRLKKGVTIIQTQLSE